MNKFWDCVKGKWNQKQKKKDFIAITVTNSLLIYMFIFFISKLLFFDKFMFEEKKVPTVTPLNALHGVYNLFFPHKSLFAVKNFLISQPLHMGEGRGGVIGFGWDWTKLILNSILIWYTVVKQTAWKNSLSRDTSSRPLFAF